MPADLVSWLASVGLLLLAFVALFVESAIRTRWRRAFAAVLAGPGLFGFLAWLHAHLPEAAPVPPPFPLVAGWANMASALAISLAAILVWRWRMKPLAAVVTGLAGLLVAWLPLATGQDYAIEVARGAAVGLLWSVASMAAAALLQVLLETGPPVTWRAWDRLAAWADRRLWGNTKALWALIALGIACRIPGIWTWAIGPDASRYAAMADALNHHGEFLMPWGDIYSPGTGLQYSHHFPPLYPAVLAGFYHLFGFSEQTTRLASFTLALAAIWVTYWCTKDLYGRMRGLIAAAIVSLSPILVLTTDKAYAENLLLLLFVLAMWCILKSLDKPWYIVGGAFFAGLGYLTKSSVGYFFIVAGLGGLAWRLHWKGWKVLRDPAYITAIILFGAMVGWWALRNWRVAGTFSSSGHLDAAYATAFAHPTSWLHLTIFSLVVMLGLGYLVFMAVLPWLPLLRRIPRLESEHDSGLWLAVGLPLVLTVMIDSALWLYERDFFLHNVRYVSFAIVPLAWLVMRHAPRSKATWAAIGITFTILIAGSLYYALPNRPLNTKVAAAFGPLVHDGDSITFIGDNDVYRYYFDVTHDGTQINHTVLYEDAVTGTEHTDWLVVRGNATGLPGGYTQVFEVQQGQGLFAERYSVWQRTTSKVV